MDQYIIRSGSMYFIGLTADLSTYGDLIPCFSPVYDAVWVFSDLDGAKKVLKEYNLPSCVIQLYNI